MSEKEQQDQSAEDGIEAGDVEQSQVITVTIQYRPRDGWSRYEVDPPQFRSRRDLLRGAISVVQDVMSYEATTEIATAAAIKQAREAEVDAVRRELEGK